MINLTPIARIWLQGRVKASRAWSGRIEEVQRKQLNAIVHEGRKTKWGRQHVINAVYSYETFLRQVNSIQTYEDFRPWVMRMIKGETNVLWPGVTTMFAQSSGTTGGKSKYIPITPDILKLNHYAGTHDVVAHYLNLYPKSRLFSGKSLILGGSYANELELPPSVKVGDLSASLIDNMPSFAERMRVPPKDIALMQDWTQKLPALIKASADQDITNISGVPSWFLTVLKGVLEYKGARTIHEVWPNLEVFFHGGISFKPYRDEYDRIIDPAKMRYLETYNASEGFFAVQNDINDPAMLLLLDHGVFYEFLPLDQVGNPMGEAVPAWGVEQGRTYALIITTCGGLWRYEIGDTVRIESVDPLKISIAGRTKNFINVFGEEVMVYNTDAALARTCSELGCAVADYTAGPVMPTEHTKGRHQWLIEWVTLPADIEQFAATLDRNLQDENSDYQAKRQGDIFLDCLSVTTIPPGSFNAWLASTGKLGGQRKVPRLSNDRQIIDQVLAAHPH